MTAVGKLAASNLTVHRARTGLTVAAIALSVSLVVAVTSGYATVESMAFRFVNRFMGTADAMLTKKATGNDPHPSFPESIVDDLRRDPDVKRVTGRLEAEAVVADAKGQTPPGHLPQVTGLQRPEDTRVEQLDVRQGRWFDASDGDVAVIDQVAAETLHAGVGGTITLPSPDGTLRLTVVGIVQKPAVLASHIQSVYVPLTTLQRFLQPGRPPCVNRVMIDLKPKVSLDGFAARWRDRLAKADPDLTLRLGRDVRDRIDQNLQGVHLMAYLGGTVAMLASTFIIFSALSMGVTERSRTLAMLRAIGASRGQVARVVVTEGVLLAGAGVLVGVPLGYLWLFIVHLRFKEAVQAGLTLSWGGVLFAAGTSAAAAVAASLLPAWWATRVDPLEAMNPSASPPPRVRGAVVAAVAGLVLVAIDPVLLFGPWDATLGIDRARWLRIWAHFFLGLPTAMVGFFLLAPAFVLVLERLAGPTVARLLSVRPALLRQQLSGGVWRAAGTCAALMVGLAVLISMETEGQSMMAGWQLPDKFPDLFIVSWSRGLDADQIAKIERVPGINPADVLPIAIASPTTGSGSEFALAMAALNPEATMFFGLDPAKGMRMMKLEFRQGTEADAIRQLNQGRHVIITDELHQLKHLNVGDPFPMMTTHGKVDFTIAAVVYSPGVDLIGSQFDMGRQFDQRTVGGVFGSLADAKAYFGVDGVRLLAADLDAGADRDKVMKNVEAALKVYGLQAGDVRHIKEGMKTAFRDVTLMVLIVPLGAMLVASLGVTNTIMASVRVRRWQLGVLRSVGLTRGQLLRLVLSEAALVGVVGAALGAFAGAVLTVDGHAMTNIVAGYHPPIVVPWAIVALGIGVVLAVAVLAGVWPAVSAARTSPLSLLQGGRAAT
jgi:putative ABC transport system permease protein